MTGNLFNDSSSPAAGWFTAHCDGGSRGNPGPSGYGAVIEDPQGRIAARLSEFLGIQTNNFAEYSGLLAVLRWSLQNGAKHLRVVSDSELMVKQMQGKYKVASPVLRPLYEDARKLSRQLEGFEMSHTLRGGNKEADRLANDAMDRGMGKGREQGIGIWEQGRPGSQSAGRTVGGSGGQPVGGSPTQPQMGVPRVPPLAPGKPQQAAAPPQVLDGYVKDGVVHLLNGELPDGVFVKIIRE